MIYGSALYSATFTPPTSPFTVLQSTTAAITGTQTALLALQTTVTSDASSNAFTLTATGTPTSVSLPSPFAIHTNSAFFDGSTAYLSISQSAGSISTGQFTIECWMYPLAYNSSIFIEDAFWYAGYNGGWYLMLNTDGTVSLSGSNGSYNTTVGFLQTTSTMSLNQWTHFACTRDSSCLLYTSPSPRD